MGPASQKSVSDWIADLKAGDEEAAERLWQRYFGRLVQRARQKLGSAPRRASDEEDVALSAFKTFCQHAAEGRFPRLFDRDDLWQVLLMLTERKALDQIKHERRQKRGGGKVRGESVFMRAGEDAPHSGINQIADPEPTPQFAAMVAEEFQHLLDLLNDPVLCDVALLKMQGYSKAEIAQKLHRVPRTIDRKLNRIRWIWSQENRP